MKQFILLIISLIGMNTIQAQTTIGEINTQEIWVSLHINMNDGTEKDETVAKLDNIQLLPENMKALITYFAALHWGENKKLAAALGFPTLAEATQILPEKWIANLETLENTPILFPLSLGFFRWDNKIFFFSGFIWSTSWRAQLFEENSDGKMLFVQQFFNVQLNKEETPDEMLKRLYNEANRK